MMIPLRAASEKRLYEIDSVWLVLFASEATTRTICPPPCGENMHSLQPENRVGDSSRPAAEDGPSAPGLVGEQLSDRNASVNKKARICNLLRVWSDQYNRPLRIVNELVVRPVQRYGAGLKTSDTGQGPWRASWNRVVKGRRFARSTKRYFVSVIGFHRTRGEEKFSGRQPAARFASSRPNRSFLAPVFSIDSPSRCWRNVSAAMNCRRSFACVGCRRFEPGRPLHKSARVQQSDPQTEQAHPATI